MDSLDAEGGGRFDVPPGIVDKEDLLRLYRCPFDGPPEDLHGGFLKSHLVRKDPFFKGPEDGEFREDIVEVKGVGIGKKSELTFLFQRKNDFGDLPVLSEDVVPDREEGFKREGEMKGLFEGLEEFGWGNLSLIETIHHAFLKIEEVEEYFLRILKDFLPRKSGEFFSDLEMIERKDDIAQVKEDHFDHKLGFLE
jgi:hypothetical protein